VFALVDHSGPKPWKLLVANIGDSRALLSRNGECVALTKDHKPTNDEELTRIRAAGGYVEFGRVDGQLALSRAVGDSPYKQNKSLPLDKQRVIAVPDITLDHLSDDDVLIVCCDGIFEAISNEETVRFTHEKVQESPDDPAYVAAQLLDTVLKKGSSFAANLLSFALHKLTYLLVRFSSLGSRDNTTAIVIQMKDGSAFNHGAQFYPGPIQAFRDDPWFVDAYTKNAQFYGLTLDDAMKRLEELKKTGAGPLVAATSIITGASSSSSSSSSTSSTAALVAENEEQPGSDSMDVETAPEKPELL
jgi:protein phosphatase PTC2/3